MRFEWDEDKRIQNLRKHRIDFRLAQAVFLDMYNATFLDRIEDGEERWRTIGQTPAGTLLTVVPTTRWQTEDEVTRIISARRATPHERRDYTEGYGEDPGGNGA